MHQTSRDHPPVSGATLAIAVISKTVFSVHVGIEEPLSYKHSYYSHLEVAVLAVEAKVVLVSFWVMASANRKQFRSATPNQSYHCFAMSSL